LVEKLVEWTVGWKVAVKDDKMVDRKEHKLVGSTAWQSVAELVVRTVVD
jgi:hypothetical protein